MLEHARLLCDWVGEVRGMIAMRKFTTWYTKSFPGGAALRVRLTRIRRLEDLRMATRDIDRSLPFPPAGMRARRGKRSGTQTVRLPHGYLDNLEDETPPGAEAEQAVSGG
jgi:hypothetical protein